MNDVHLPSLCWSEFDSHGFDILRERQKCVGGQSESSKCLEGIRASPDDLASMNLNAVEL